MADLTAARPTGGKVPGARPAPPATTAAYIAMTRRKQMYGGILLVLLAPVIQQLMHGVK